MGNNLVSAFVVVATAVIGVAIIAVLVKQGNQTASVLGAAGKSFGSILSIAENPGGSSGFGTTGGGAISTIS